MAFEQKIWSIEINESHSEKRLSEILRAEIEGLSSRNVVMIVNNGLVIRDEEPEKNLSATFEPGAVLTVDLRHGVKGQSKPKRPPLIENMRVVYDDDALVVVCKAAGITVNPVDTPAKGRKKPDTKKKNTLKSNVPPLVELLKHYWKKKHEEVVNPILVHRLDRETSGLLVLAKTLPAARVLQRQAAGRNMERRYVALVEGKMKKDKGTWTTWMYEDASGWKRSFEDNGRVVTDPEQAPDYTKIAITHYQVLERFEMTTLVELRLETGRTHQIRIHCAECAHPIVGDRVYIKLAKMKFPMIPFGKELNPSRRMMLHSLHLKFQHPIQTTRWLTNKDEIPPIFREFARRQDKKILGKAEAQ